MNHDAARAAFDAALASHVPGFGTFFLARLLGLDIAYPGDACTVAFDAADWMFNPQGTLHGGIIGTVLDISMGHLLNRAAGPGATLQMGVQYLGAARDGRLTATARFQRQGRSICALESRMADAAGQPIAAATSTWRLLDKPGTRP